MGPAVDKKKRNNCLNSRSRKWAVPFFLKDFTDEKGKTTVAIEEVVNFKIREKEKIKRVDVVGKVAVR